MQYEFLKLFPKRMKNVGSYSILIQNIIQKTTWRQYGFIKADEQINLTFAVLLYIMEQSLKEESCTMDDIGAFIDDLNTAYFEKNMSYEDCKALGDFMVNVVLSNEGKAMYFDGFEFEQKAYQIMHISYVANRIIYVDAEVRRTSYYLTDDGYNLLLGTLEIENNMKLTIHEMIFKMHLERQSYDKAVDEIKQVFQLLHIQLQKIQEAMGKIRRNVLNYSVADYEHILDENMETIDNTKQKFQDYREHVKARARELEEENINVRRLNEKEEEKLNNLRMIELYLNRTIDEHQKILNHHFDLKSLYTKELEALSQMSLIQRFSIRSELYDKLLERPAGLLSLESFLRPLFHQAPEKIYNLNKAVELQRPIRKKEEEEAEEVLDFDEDAWQEEQLRQQLEKLKKYETSLRMLLRYVLQNNEISLAEISGQLSETELADFIPNVEIFKEIMVELIQNKTIDLAALQKERSEFITDKSGSFELNEMLLNLSDQMPEMAAVTGFEIYRMEDGKMVTFHQVKNEKGEVKNIRCSNLLIRALKADEGGNSHGI